MYSGTTLTPMSGRIIGAHQKFDRAARARLSEVSGGATGFPPIRQILHFEGRKGPDAIKRKSPAKDEPWHYYSPFDNSDSNLLELINDHYAELVKELKQNNQERAAFEAAWLAHAIVDGLTPAHHYPYEEKLTELRGGKGIETRTSYKEKIIMHGETKREKLSNNWKMWGPRGLFTTHGFFEFGIATLIAPLSMGNARPSQQELIDIQKLGVTEIFKRVAREIAVLDMYERYRKRGWTTKLVWEVRNKLAPSITKTVTLAWYVAMLDAGLIRTEKT